MGVTLGESCKVNGRKSLKLKCLSNFVYMVDKCRKKAKKKKQETGMVQEYFKSEKTCDGTDVNSNLKEIPPQDDVHYQKTKSFSVDDDLQIDGYEAFTSAVQTGLNSSYPKETAISESLEPSAAVLPSRTGESFISSRLLI